MQSIINVENISKKYLLGSIHQPYLTFRENFTSLFSFQKKNRNYFYALKDLSFKVEPGESIGIIGKNGAGKSTLLKILSRITQPSDGKILLRGRVASLLEVGTGFHGELSGRENIYFNGSILGMKKKEIDRKFDEIVQFSGIEQFIDTPLKHYSSGMQVRLAFSVAAYLEAEILLFDEVLAVGDAEFQKKCFGKIEDVSKSGRTILFVSHNIGSIQSLCKKTILLEKGKLLSYDNSASVIEQYLNNVYKQSSYILWERNKMPGDHIVKLNSVSLKNDKGEIATSYYNNDPIYIEMEYELLQAGFIPYPNIHVFSAYGEQVFTSVHEDNELLSKTGKHRAILQIPSRLLNSGLYSVGIAISSFSPSVKIHLYEQHCLYFEVIEDINKRNHPFRDRLPGLVLQEFSWQSIIIH